MKQQFDNENAIQMFAKSKSNLHSLPQLALFPDYQKNCKCIREIAIFPKSSSDPHKMTFSRLYSEAFQPPVIDKMEQMLEFAINLLRERQLEDTFYLSLVCEPYAFYNEVKGKYEPTKGAFKSADEMVHVYLNLLQAYPQIKVLKNPFRTEDWHAWLKLQETIKKLDSRLLVEICASSDALNTGSVLRLSPSPSISELAHLLNQTSQSHGERDKMHPFGVSNIISFDGTFAAQTSCCFLLDIAEAILWVKCE
ncbi:Enolase 4 [Taenia solium]|uniref:phosphopyruvate hydratase n=1 Tax=Taenia solium TaxID=6204 RepID=A0A2P1BTJ0_TAESO|nr:enolase 4 [Taenia solium]|eukprot:TsM_000741300 transcript=TsM_000741300 gene=TsM_000741300